MLIVSQEEGMHSVLGLQKKTYLLHIYCGYLLFICVYVVLNVDNC